MSTELIINASLPETRIAMLEDSEIQELLIERASGKGIVGNIYKGKVTRVLPGMQAAFVDIGLEKAAFLYVDDVYVHSEIWEEEEGMSEPSESVEPSGEIQAASVDQPGTAESAESSAGGEAVPEGVAASQSANEPMHEGLAHSGRELPELGEEDDIPGDFDGPEEDDEDEDHGPVEMGPGPGGEDDDNIGNRASDQPEGTIRPSQSADENTGNRNEAASDAPAMEGGDAQQAGGANPSGQGGAPGQHSEREGRGRRHRRGRRGGRLRNKSRDGQQQSPGGADLSGASKGGGNLDSAEMPDSYQEQIADEGGSLDSDRSVITASVADGADEAGHPTNRPGSEEGGVEKRGPSTVDRQDFKAQRGRDRRIRPKQAARPVRAQVNIQDLLKEGQEVLVQVAKDPIATKGARLTCHISLPGRHLVCMPTIDHVGVSRRIERDDERRRLRDFVERNRPKNLGFIVRTASGRQQSEKRIKQDIDYLTRIWTEIREKAANVTAPALVYEDLNSVLRAIRDWVTEDIDKIIVDSRYHYNEMQKFISHFMPSLKQKVELYHGDIPIFDAYGISTELSRALERKVWLKSGGYIVIDQAEALVAIDVNTGRYVGKKNLEDTILKTNLEAVQEIAYQLRLRNAGGIIILDLIDMEKEENKQRVYRALEEALKKDRARPSILKISELGLVEMTRKRTRDTMVRALCESCSNCEGKGYIKSKQTVAYEVLREVERAGIEKDVSKILIQSHADVIDILAIDERETLDQLERRYRKQILLQAVADFHPEQFEVSLDKKERSEQAQDRQQNQRRDSQQSQGRGRDRDRGRGRDRGRDRDRGDQQRQAGGQGGQQQGRDRDRGRDRNRDRNRNQNQQNLDANTEQEAQLHPGAQVGEAGDGQPPRHFDAAHEAGGQVSGEHAQAGHERDDFEEEDRLAFLRAQAAQDAALARLNNAGAPASNRNGNNPNGGRGPGGGGGAGGNAGSGGERGRRGRRGRRGGKFRRDRDRGPRMNPQSGGNGGGGEGGAPTGGDSGGGAGGGGDQSQPPTT